MSSNFKASSVFEERGVNVREQCLQVLEVMLQTRLIDDKMSKLVRQNKGGNFHLSTNGHEMIGAICALSLVPGKDWGLPYYRDRAFALGIGCSPTELFAALLARDTPHHSSGRMMPEHFSHKALRLPCQSSCVGSQFLQAVGVAKAISLDGKDEVVYVSSGDGATSQGDFHEALNFSCLHRLGVIFVVQDNGWAISVPIEEQTAGGSIAQFAQGYSGLCVFDVDGCDFEQVSKAAHEAILRGRRKEGPSLIVAKVPRLGAHSSSDDPLKYKSLDLIEEEKKKDPIFLYENWLLDMGLITSDDLESMKERLHLEVEAAAHAAEKIPSPDKKTVSNHVFKDFDIPQSSCSTLETDSPNSSDASLVMMDALNHALDEEMKRDSRVIIFGQDVARDKGGVFGITRNLTKKHGENRCFNTPLAESTIIGISIGLSFAGYRPVAEIQFADYLWTGINQLFNELSSLHYRSNGEWNCPVVIRMPYGGYIQGGPYHSQSIEAFLCHCPGLKVVIPSNAADAKRLLKAAIRDPNPVIFLEHKALYRQRVFCARLEPKDDELLPFGKARIVRSGKDVTVVSWGMMTYMGFEIAERLSQEGIDIELIDLRTLSPLDMDSVIASVRKTGKLLIAHEAARTGGFAGEIIARIVEEAFSFLDAPAVRITGKDCPVPYSKELEDEVLPQSLDLELGIRKLYRF